MQPYKGLKYLVLFFFLVSNKFLFFTNNAQLKNSFLVNFWKKKHSFNFSFTR